MPRHKTGQKKKIQVMVDQEVFDIYEDMAQLTGRSLSATAADVLVEAAPAISKMARIIETLDADVTGGIRDLADFVYQAAQEAKQLGMEFEQEAKRRN